MSPRLMSEPRAWREIARRVEKRGLRASGLCYEVECSASQYRSDEGPIIDQDTARRMKARIDGHLMGRTYILEDDERGFGTEAAQDDVRILAALFLALEAEDESRRVSPPGGAR